MTDFIIMLEDMLRANGVEDWEIKYFPEEKAYILEYDGKRIILMDYDDPIEEEFRKEIMNDSI